MNTLTTNAAFQKHARGRTVAQASVKGGFPVLVTGVVHESDPEVGYFGRWVDSCDIEVFTLRGCPAPFIEKKLSKSDWLELETALLEQADKESF